MKQIVVDKGRTVILPVSLGFDVSQDVITSQIRITKSPTSTLIATWVVSFTTNGTDGELILTLDDSVTSAITQSIGYMDLKRVSGGQPLSIFSEPLEVVFNTVVTP
jgi:hypothetical protein